MGQRPREQVLERSQTQAMVVAEVRVVTREEVAAERVAVRAAGARTRGHRGGRAVVLPLVEADRREQLGRVERRQGLGGGARLKQKLIDQARALRERIGQQLGRVKEWVREHFPDPIGRLKERSREVFETVVEKAREARRRLTQEPEQGPERSAAGGQKRGMFDGLRLGAERSQGAPSGRDPFASVQFSATPEASPGRVQTPAAQTLSQSLDRYAQAWMDAWRMRERDLPVLEHQKTELKAAGEDLDEHRPGARQALNSALRHELPVRRAMMEMEGSSAPARFSPVSSRRRGSNGTPTFGPSAWSRNGMGSRRSARNSKSR